MRQRHTGAGIGAGGAAINRRLEYRGDVGFGDVDHHDAPPDRGGRGGGDPFEPRQISPLAAQPQRPAGQLRIQRDDLDRVGHGGGLPRLHRRLGRIDRQHAIDLARLAAFGRGRDIDPALVGGDIQGGPACLVL